MSGVDEFGAFDEQPNNNLNFDQTEDDAFAAASDPFNMDNGMAMNT